MFAKFFIEHPVLANVIALVIILLGGVAVFLLPVSEYPPITPPTIQVTTTYPGASAKTLVETVALPIEQQVNGVEKMLYMQSNCTADGRYTLTVTFQVGTDLDFAQVLVQNRVAAATAQLPMAVQQQGIVTKKKETAPLQIITLSSKDERYDALFLSNFGALQLRDKLARLPGGGDVGQITRLRDVGRVELGARSYSQLFKVDGKAAGGIAIYQLPGANALATAKGVRKLLDSLAPGFPSGLTYQIPFDTTAFVRES